MADLSSWLPLIGPFTVQEEGTEVPRRGTINFTGNGVTVTDDPDNEKTEIDIGIAGISDDGSTMTIERTASQATGNARCKLYDNIVNVQTTDATVTSAFTWTITDEAVTLVTVTALAVKSDGTATAAYTRRVRIKRDGGTVTVGTVEDNYTSEDSLNGDVTIDNSTSTGRVRVTGVAATTIDWGVLISRLEVTHA